MSKEQEQNNSLSLIAKIAGVVSILFALFLSINSFYSFYRVKILGEPFQDFQSSFFNENSLTWAHLIFGILFLGAIYIAYTGFVKKQSFNIFMSLIYTFALVSLFVSYVAV